MNKQLQSASWSHQVGWFIVVAAFSLFAASSANAQWAAKPPPPLPQTVLDQGWTGSVVLGLVFNENGSVRDVRIIRSSGIAGLDEMTLRGAMGWRLDPAAVRPSDTTVGRQHLVKFFQDKRVAKRVAPYQAFWKEL